MDTKATQSKQQPAKKSDLHKLLVSSVSGVALEIATFPLDAVKVHTYLSATHQQSATTLVPANAVQTASRLLADGGVRRLFRGMSPSIGGLLSGSAMSYAITQGTTEPDAAPLPNLSEFAAYSSVMVLGGLSYQIVVNPADVRDFAVGNVVKQRLQLGHYSGTVNCVQTAAAMTTPFDVVKTRLQTQQLNMVWESVFCVYLRQYQPPSASDMPYRGFFSTARQIARQEGFKALFRGVGPRMCMTAPIIAIPVAVESVLEEYLSA
ncbi:hypothetical protein ACHHYP_01866 [Achlya hypogyna]|uniref:Mitochondrial Carrier (MC) Family n=1 Tax=Achlya hypogyna TaxID=1202772 RepID=A0A1V9Z8A4_ACHHY|nr:hypothetical protein ACHHYP_01866 [Achlya hypogyna]